MDKYLHEKWFKVIEYNKGDNNSFIKSEFIWPLSRSITPDEMNTSFGPRINRNKRQFHEGIDLPAPCGRCVYAMHSGTIRFGNFESTHVIIEAEPNSKSSKSLFLIYLHLSYINQDIKEGSRVKTGDYIGNVGDDGASYCHLHIEFRRGTLKRGSSTHPLKYLPYFDTFNFNGELTAKYQRSISFK